MEEKLKENKEEKLEKMYVISYYETEKIDNVVYDKHNLYDGGYGVELFNSIDCAKEQIIKLCNFIKSKNLKVEGMSIFLTEYDTNSFEDSVKKIQDYYNWDVWDNENEKEVYLDKLDIEEFIFNLEEIKVIKSYDIYKDRKICSNDLCDLFEFDIVDKSLDLFQKYFEDFEDKEANSLDEKNELISEVIYDLNKEFAFFNEKEEKKLETFLNKVLDEKIENIKQNKKMSIKDKIKEKQAIVSQNKEKNKNPQVENKLRNTSI